MYIVQKNIDIKTWGIKKTKEKTVLEGGYFCSLGKNKARNTIFKLAKKTGSIAELGIGKDGVFHKMVRQKAPEVKIKSIDDGRNFGNKKELEKMTKQYPNMIISDFSQWAKQGLETFAVVWADYCGPWTNRVARDIRMATRIMQGKGYIALTLLEAREHVHELGLPKGSTRAQINKAVEKAMKKAFKEAGLKVTKFKEIKYKSSPQQEGRDSKHRSNMRVPIFAFRKM